MCKLSGDFRQERTGMHAIVKLEYVQLYATSYDRRALAHTKYMLYNRGVK